MFFYFIYPSLITLQYTYPDDYLVFPSYNYYALCISFWYPSEHLLWHHGGPLYATLLTHKKRPELPDFVVICV